MADPALRLLLVEDHPGDARLFRELLVDGPLLVEVIHHARLRGLHGEASCGGPGICRHPAMLEINKHVIHKAQRGRACDIHGHPGGQLVALLAGLHLHHGVAGWHGRYSRALVRRWDRSR